MAMTQPELNAMDTRWQVTAGDNRPKFSKVSLVHMIAMELVLFRKGVFTANEHDTAMTDAIGYVNSKTEDARGLRP